MTDDTMGKIVALTKRKGFIFQGSELYGGLAGTWDYGPLGVALKNNIKQLWWKMFVNERDDIYGLDAAILMNEKVWEASGHTGAGFADPLVECQACKKRFRADHLDNKTECPDCGGALGEERNFNLMFETKVGAQGDTKSYLRPETAQGIFVNYKNIIDTMHPKLPFGIAQIGKAFRNEIAPRDFIFRSREFEQMEIEYFVRANEWEQHFEGLRTNIWEFIDALGLPRNLVCEHEVPEKDLAHYSKRTIDFEFNYEGKGFDELLGFAYRTDFDLRNHGVADAYVDPDGSRPSVHVLEPSFGVDRALMAVLSSAYREDALGGEQRVYLALPKQLAPYAAMVSPLLKNKPELVAKAREVYQQLKTNNYGLKTIAWDDNGNIGKRYRRQDEIGTPHCITIDFDTLQDSTVTVRERDSGTQTRVPIAKLADVVHS